jgi:phosphatidylglycerol---prolipoprotein diacylglyceryl transferase
MELQMNTLPLAYLLDWGWLRIGPPYIYININPVLVQLGPLAVRWYGLMYVVAIIVGLWVIKGYTQRKGIDQDMVYRVLWWCIAAGVIGGRLYFVVQQPNLVQEYLLKPQNILATWEGGMAFYGAIFLVIPTLIWRARKERVNPLVLIDAGVLLAAAGQIFGRIGNLINGDIIGYPSTLPWSTVYQNPNSWACFDPNTCNVPVQPAAGYELLTNIVVLAVILYLARTVRRPGILMLFYLFCYTITQFFLFFVLANIYVDFLGITVLKQAQWTSIIVFIVLLPLTYLVLRISKPVPKGEVAATYGIPQVQKNDESMETTSLNESEDDETEDQITSIDAKEDDQIEDNVENTPDNDKQEDQEAVTNVQPQAEDSTEVQNEDLENEDNEARSKAESSHHTL